MRTGNILISSASAKIPLLQTIRKSVQKFDPSIRIIAGDCDRKCIAKYFSDDFWHMPILSELTDRQLLENLSKYNITFIIPTRDGELYYWGLKRDWLKTYGIYVMISDKNSIEICLDKNIFYQHCIKKNISVIPTSSSIHDLQAYYYVVKEQNGSGSNKIGLKLNKKEALKHAYMLKNPIFQPYIDGKEYSIDAYVNSAGKIHGAVCRERTKIVQGESQITTIIHDNVLLKQGCEYIEKLQLYGHIMIQIFEASKNIFLIECNARFGGASTLSVIAGLDSFYWFLLEAQGKNLKDYPFQPSQKKLRQIRFPQDRIEEIS